VCVALSLYVGVVIFLYVFVMLLSVMQERYSCFAFLMLDWIVNSLSLYVFLEAQRS
jgi:hypothetical protein